MRRSCPEKAVSWEGLIMLAVLLMTVPLPWVGAAITAGGIHEACHWGMIWILGGKVRKFKMGGSGAVLDIAPMTNGKELLAAAAGPTGSLLLLLLKDFFPRVSLCGLVQGLFNLLPVYPMDGGRILKCFLRLFLTENQTDQISKGVETGVIILLIFSIFISLTIHFMGLKPVILITMVLFRIINRKIPCKETIERVQ